MSENENGVKELGILWNQVTGELRLTRSPNLQTNADIALMLRLADDTFLAGMKTPVGRVRAPAFASGIQVRKVDRE